MQGSTTSVRVSAIEGTLTRLWGDAERSDDQVPLLRPRTANLIVVATDAAEVEEAGEVAVRLAARHPGRTIVVGPQPTASQLTANVGVHCPLTPDGRGRLCTEVVSLAGPPDGLEDARGIVAGLLVADLPTYLWWRRPVPVAERLFSGLVRLADCLVVDSRTFDDAAVGLAWLKDVADRHRRELDIIDLEWERIATWRSFIASAFRTSDTRRALDTLHEVVVSHGTGAPAHSTAVLPASVLLIGGWLASRLDWRLVDAGSSGRPRATSSTSLRYQGRFGEIVVRSVPSTDPAVPHGEIAGVELVSEVDSGVVRVVVDRAPNGTCVVTTATIGEEIVRRQMTPLPARRLVDLVATALDVAATDPTYADALQCAVG